MYTKDIISGFLYKFMPKTLLAGFIYYRFMSKLTSYTSLYKIHCYLVNILHIFISVSVKPNIDL